jgi:cytochrome c553
MHRTQLLSLALLAMLVPIGAAADTDESDADLAERIVACAACHGEAGRSAAEVYFPSIAGKPAGYVFAQLEHYRAGRRRHVIMEGLLANLSDDYLREIAEYYARQAPQWTPPSDPRSDEQLARGRRLVEEGDPELDIPSCRACHGESLTGIAPSIPGLVGLRPEYLSAQLGAWRAGARRAAEPDCMAAIAERLTRSDIGAVTAWIASRPYPGDHRPLAGPPGALPMPCGVGR